MPNRSSVFLISARNMIFTLVATLVVWGSVPAFAQYYTTSHYVGGNLRFVDDGWGLGGEFGWTISRTYFGLEAGINHLSGLSNANIYATYGQPPIQRYLLSHSLAFTLVTTFWIGWASELLHREAPLNIGIVEF